MCLFFGLSPVNLKTIQPSPLQSMLHTRDEILNPLSPSVASEIIDPPKSLGTPGSSASVSLHPVETVAANVSQPQQIQKIYLYTGVLEEFFFPQCAKIYAISIQLM